MYRNIVTWNFSTGNGHSLSIMPQVNSSQFSNELAGQRQRCQIVQKTPAGASMAYSSLTGVLLPSLGLFSGNWLQSATGGLSLLCGSASRRNAVAVHSRGLSRPTTRRRITCRSRSLARPQPWKLRMCPLSNRAARPLAVTRSCLSALLARKPRWLRRSTRAGLGSLRRPLLSSDRAVKSPCFSPFLAHPFKIMRTPARDWTDHLEAQQCENIAMHKATSRPALD
jgi:hypothetical protein